MIVRPMEFGMIQQQNTVSQVRHNEDVRPMVEQQTTAVQLQKDIHTRAEQVNHKEDLITDRKSLMLRIKVITSISLDIKKGKIRHQKTVKCLLKTWKI